MLNINIILLCLISTTSITTGQWMQYIDNNLTPFPSISPLSEELILPKQTTNIPIFVLLKPRRAKSLSSESSDNAERRSSNGQPLDINQWMGMPDLNGDRIPDNKININQQLLDLGKALETQQSTSVMPKNDNNEDITTTKPRGGERIQWPSNGKKSTISPATIASISNLLPNFAALSQSNQELAKLAQNSGAFEDALKKFTSNLTDFEHRISGNEDKSGSSDDPNSTHKIDGNVENEDNLNDSKVESIESKSGNNDDIRVDEVIDNYEDSIQSDSLQSDNNKNNHKKQVMQKSSPLISERQQIKMPINTESDQRIAQIHKGFQPLSQTAVNKGWLPIKNRKPKPKPAVRERHKTIPTMSSYAGHQQLKNPFLGMPELSPDFPEVQRPRRYFNPFNHMFNENRNSIRHLPFDKYSSYLSESEFSPTLEAFADANKPQHMEPIKEQVAGNEEMKHKDMHEEKEHVIDDKQQGIVDEKHQIIDEKHMGLSHGLGDNGVFGPHHQLACCELLHNQRNGQKHVIHEEVIGAHFDEHNFDFGGHQPPIHPMHHHFKHQSHHPLPHKTQIGCHEDFTHLDHNLHGEHQFLWPQHVYRPPPIRPKLGLFSKPLFFG